MLFSLALMTLSPFMVDRGDAQGWPAKRDDVYISATIEYEQHSLSAVGEVNRGRRTSTALPCTRLTMLQLKSDKMPWVLRPWSNASSLNRPDSNLGAAKPLEASEIRLRGPWQPRMFRSEAECRQHYATAGEPRASLRGADFVIQSGG